MTSLTPAAIQNENLHIHIGKGVEGSKLGVIQNENLHILKGKAVDGAKSGIIQNENLHILKGKGVEGFKAEVPRPAKAGRQVRKALRDLSESRKPVISAANKATALKDKSTVRETAKKEPKSNILTEEEISKCREWAKDGIEHMHFSGNDMRKFEACQQEERVRKKVDKAMSALREWTDMTFGLDIPVMEVPSDTEDDLQLKFESDLLTPTPRILSSLPKKSGYEEIDELLELDYDSIFFDRQIEIKLKEEYESDAAFF